MKNLALIYFMFTGGSICCARPVVTLRPRTLGVDLKRYMDTSVNVAGLSDHCFGRCGFVKQPFVTSDLFDIATGLAVTSDGRILLAGYAGDAIASEWQVALVRYLPCGALDASFGNGGVVLRQFSNLLYDQINAVALQTDGCLVAGGETRVGVGQYQFLLARYLENGTLDMTYGFQGVVQQPFLGTGFYDEIQALVIAPSGMSVVTGYSKDAGGQKLVVASYTGTGVANESFGVAGKVVQSFIGDQHNDIGTAVIVDADGSVVVAGTSDDGGPGKVKCVLLKYDARGALMRSFGNNGIVLQPFLGTGNHDEITCIGLQSDGGILVGGFTADAGGRKVLLMRYTKQGTLDDTFGQGGIVAQSFLTGVPGNDVINALVIQIDRKIVVAGSTDGGFGDRYFLARYDGQGKLDSSFGNGGFVVGPFIGDGSGDEIQDLALTSAGRLIATGCTLDTGGSKMFVTRVMNAD